MRSLHQSLAPAVAAVLFGACSLSINSYLMLCLQLKSYGNVGPTKPSPDNGGLCSPQLSCAELGAELHRNAQVVRIRSCAVC